LTIPARESVRIVEQRPKGVPVAHRELPHEGGDVAADRRCREEQSLTDLGRAETLDEQLEDVRFPAGQVGAGPRRLPEGADTARTSELSEQPAGQVAGNGGPSFRCTSGTGQGPVRAANNHRSGNPARGSRMPRGTSRASRRQRRALVEAASLAVMELDLTNDLLRAQRIEVVGQMAGGIAHDFNNLLTVILGHAALLATTLPESDD